MSKRKKFGISKHLTTSLSDTVQAVANHAGALRYEVVPLHRIELDPRNPREMTLNRDDLPDGPFDTDPEYELKQKEKASLKSLARSISQQGIINPVWLYKHERQYRLIAGERRVLAAIMANREDIPAKVMSERPVETDLRLIQWFENVERSDLSLWERLNNLELITSAYQEQGNQVTPTVIKHWLGCSLPQAMQYHAVLSSPDVIRAYIQSGVINSLEKATLLAQNYDKNWYDELRDQCLAGLSLKRLQAWVASKRRPVSAISQIKTSETRGRKASQIRLGQVKNPQIVIRLVKAILSDPSYQAYQEQFVDVDWSNYQKASQAFQRLLLLIEKTEGSSS